MSISTRSRGFSLIEMLLVLAIMGILGTIAIPKYLGQRHRARVIGDAISNAKVLQMALESHKADTGLYGTDNTSYQWNATYNSGDSGYTLIPTFQPSQNSKMNYTVKVTGGGVTYTLDVYDPALSLAEPVYETNERGQQLKRMNM